MNGPYAAAKFGVNSLTMTLAAELAPRVRVVGVSPGPIPTEVMIEYTGMSEEQLRQGLGSMLPLQRIGEPEDVAAAVVLPRVTRRLVGDGRHALRHGRQLAPKWPGRSKGRWRDPQLGLGTGLATGETARKRPGKGCCATPIPNDRAFGLAMRDMKRYAKEVGKDHDLALTLWETGWYEARTVAVFIAEPAAVTSAQMDAWAADFDNWARSATRRASTCLIGPVTPGVKRRSGRGRGASSRSARPSPCSGGSVSTTRKRTMTGSWTRWSGSSTAPRTTGST